MLSRMSASSPSKMTAKLVSVWSDDALAGAALAEREDSSGWNLVFERVKSPSEADRKAGQDTYCITNEAGAAAYGGIVGWSIAGAHLNLTLDARTSGELGLGPELVIALPAGHVAELAAGLAEILA
jgi:hypothetical protein